MVRSVSFTSPYDAQQLQLDRQAQYAEALRQQGMEPLQGGMAGRVFVGPSITQGLAQMLKAYGGRKGVEQAENKSVALANERQQAMVDALRGFGKSGDPSALLENADTAALGAQGMLDERQAAREAQIAADKASDDRRWQAEQARILREFNAEQKALDRDARIEAGRLGGGSIPSTVQEWQYFNSLSPEDQKRFLVMKRANPYLNLGGEQVQMNPVMPGERLDTQVVTPKPEQMPEFKQEQAFATAQGKAEGTAAAEAAINLPQTVAGADQTIGLIDQILAHPGLEDAVGVKGASMGFGLFPSAVPGSDAADFNALLGQLQGKQFLEAFESLKGGGQITQVEGEKATNAIAAMQTAQSEEQFKQAAKAFRDVVEGAKRRAIQKAQGQSSGATGSFDAPPATATVGELTPEEMAEMEQLRRELGL